MIQKTGTGQSESIPLPAGEYVLHFESEAAFALELLSGRLGSTVKKSYYGEGTTQVLIDSSTGPQSVRVPGGVSYAFNTTSGGTEPVTMYATSVTL